MRKETIKTIIITLLSIIFIAHSIEKKSIIDKLQLEKDELQSLVESGNKSMMAATGLITGLEIAIKKCGEELNKNIKKCSEELNKNNNNVHNVTVTMYQPVPEQTDSTPNITADGTVIKVDRASEYRYVAVSQNMLVKNGGFLKFGDYVWVDAGKKSGVYQVRDVMNRRFTNRIDILEGVNVRPYKYDNARMVKLVYAD